MTIERQSLGTDADGDDAASVAAGHPHRPRWSWVASGWFVATIWVGLSSPFFVRAYLPNETHLGISVPAPGSIYRWRSEGFSNTHIGPLGMPGRRTLPPSGTKAWALWGDSQAEGLPVADEKKLFAQVQRRTSRPVLPLGRSGDGLGDWIAQWPELEKAVPIETHCVLVVDFPDLLDLAPPTPPTPGRLGGLTARVPAFVVHATRNVLTEADGSPRRLRFLPGPVPRSSETTDFKLADAPEMDEASPVTASQIAAIRQSIKRIAAATTRPVKFIYCPPRPIIVHGQWVREDPHAAAAKVFADLLADHPEASRLAWIDMTDAFAESVRRGEIPLGFHNGEIGVGHVNEIGYRLIAEEIADRKRLF